MKRGMRLAWGLLASAAVAAMTACGNRDAGDMDKTAAGTTGQMQSEETETAVSEEEALEDRMLTVAVFEDTGTLNPYTGESPAYALDWVYEGLTAMENGVPVPELAREWEISGDGLTYTFHLRPDVKFSDGSPFTAENAKRNMDLVLGHREYYPYLPSLAVISSVEAADETTLTVHLTAPAPSLLNDLAGSYPFGMMGDEGFAAEGDVYQSAGALAEPEEENGFSTLGTGMWKLKTYVEGEYSVFERNEAYWGEKPGFRYLRTVVCSSAEEAAEAMKAGEADVMVDSEHITLELFKELEEAGFQTASAPSSSISVLNLNTAGPVTEIRQCAWPWSMPQAVRRSQKRSMEGSRNRQVPIFPGEYPERTWGSLPMARIWRRQEGSWRKQAGPMRRERPSGPKTASGWSSGWYTTIPLPETARWESC